jgi:2-keto-4-pentenoate hydratase/2-oxohepta-3-ene-1,7-dioic acid hydratase in catechol pathway
LHSSFYLETVLHVSGGTPTHNKNRKQLYLQHLVFVMPLLPSAAIAADGSNGNNKAQKTAKDVEFSVVFFFIKLGSFNLDTK